MFSLLLCSADQGLYLMMLDSPFSLHNKVALVSGLANRDSIAFGCAQALNQAGARVIVTYMPGAERFVLPLADELGNAELMPCDVQDDAQLTRLFTHIADRYGGVDVVVHSIAYAPIEDLRGRLVDASRQGFLLAMDISCHSFLRMARLAEPLMSEGGTLINMSYLGAERVVQNYALMGPVKAALESMTRYMAAELGPQGIRVHAVSPGPIRTRAASGLKDFDTLADASEHRAPLRRLATIRDVGNTVVYLASPAGAATTGGVHYIDAGDNIMYIGSEGD